MTKEEFQIEWKVIMAMSDVERAAIRARLLSARVLNDLMLVAHDLFLEHDPEELTRRVKKADDDPDADSDVRSLADPPAQTDPLFSQAALDVQRSTETLALDGAAAAQMRAQT